MRKLFFLIAFLLFSYVIYHDVTLGTLPTVKTEGNLSIAKDLSYKMVRVQRGDTLISIFEHVQTSKHKVSIKKLVEDFKTLNNGVLPNEIQVGHTYKIPIYPQ